MARPVAITGSSGLVGRALRARLGADALCVVRAPRGAEGATIAWDPRAGVIDRRGLAAARAVVHLAGENIGAERWTPARKQALVDSRVASTDLLARTLADLRDGPRTLVCASAVGFYGDRGDEELDETSARGSGFLADLVDAWERAADPARAAGVRVVHLRFGMILARGGGALAKMVPMFKAGLGGPLGSGRQWVSAIGLGDAVRTIVDALDGDAEGAFNACIPEPVRNVDFARALGTALGRPAWTPAPAFAIRLAVGRELADELVLASQRVRPRRLLERGFTFEEPTVADAVRAALG